MFGFSRYIDSASSWFEAMFEPDGDDFLFYRGPGYPGVRVTKVERDAFVATYRRQFAIFLFAMCVWALVVIVAMVVTDVDEDSWTYLIEMGLIIVPILIGAFWLIRAPIRALARRAPATGVQTRADMRRRTLGHVGWGQIMLAIVIGPFIVWSTTGFDFSAPKSWFFGAVGAFCSGGGVLAAFRKRAYERENA